MYSVKWNTVTTVYLLIRLDKEVAADSKEAKQGQAAPPEAASSNGG